MYLHHDLGDHQQAKEYYEHALSIQLKKLGPDHVDVALTYHNMGTLHKDLGNHQQAKEYYELALSIQLKKFGPDHVYVPRTSRLLGDVQCVLDAQQQLAHRIIDVSSETLNLQRVFRPGRGGGGLFPHIGYIGMCRAKGYGFLAVLVSEIGYQFRPSWSEIGYGLCTLVLNWEVFLEELATSSSFGDKTISLLMFTPTTVYVP